MMRYFGALIALLVVGIAPLGSAERCDRIVSLAPSVSEILKSLDLAANIVAVSSYDELSADVPAIGGLLDPSIEGIVVSKPSVVFALTEQSDLTSRLNKLGLMTVLLEHRTLNGLFESITQIGKLCAKDETATQVRTHIIAALDALKRRSREYPITKVLMVVSRDYESRTLRDLYISGDDGYYGYILPYVGAENVVKGQTTSFSSISVEYLSRVNPDVIVEVFPPNFLSTHSKDELLKAWRAVDGVEAVKKRRVYMLDEPWATIPGPDVTILAGRLMEILHAK